MARVTRTIHLRVLTYDPVADAMIPVPGAGLLVEDSGFLWDPDLSTGSPVTGADGRAAVEIAFEDTAENALNPFFTIRVPEASRNQPPGAAADRRITLPGEWVTRHDAGRRIPRITDHADPNRALDLFVGLPADLRIAYADFHRTGRRDPFALPQDTARVYLADRDVFLFDFLDFLIPDDTVTGFGADPRRQRVVRAGENDRYPYFDTWPTAPAALDEPPPAEPRAWLDPPGAPVGTLGGGSFAAVGPLATDGHGFVFVVDADAVRRFYPDGTLCETIRPAAGGFTDPGGLAVDQHRNLFVADTGRDRVVAFALAWREGESGVYEERPPALDTLTLPPAVTVVDGVTIDRPRGLAVVPHPAVDGEELLAIANQGAADVLLFAIQLSGDPLASHRASAALTASLAFRARIGGPGAGPDGFMRPVAVAADRAGRLFVADAGRHRVTRWAPDAGGVYRHQAAWGTADGTAGAAAGELSDPVAVAADGDRGWVYVAEAGNRRVQRLDAESGDSHLRWAPEVAGGPATPAGLAVDARGEVYLADSAHSRVLRATPFGADSAAPVTAAAPRPVGVPWSDRAAADRMSEPGYVVFDPAGRLWVADTGNDRVQVFVPQADGRLALDAALAPPAADLRRPVGLAFDPDGDVWVACSGDHRVRRFGGAPPAARATVIGTGAAGRAAGELDDPRGLAVVRRDEPLLYVADRGNDRVQVFRRDGSLATSLALPAGDAFDAPEDVAVDSRGNVYVADTGNARLVQLGPDDAFVRAITLAEPGFSLGEPCGVAVDDEDKLLVADRARNKVLRIAADGTLLAFWELERLPRSDRFDRPYEPELARLLTLIAPARAAIDPAGRLAVAEPGRDRVRLVRTATRLNVNLFDLGTSVERLPDLSLRVIPKADWRQEIGLAATVGDASIFDESQDFEADPVEDFAGDRFDQRLLLGHARGTASAINVLRVIRRVQEWLRHLTREDDEDGRWGTPERAESLAVDLTSSAGSDAFVQINLGENNQAGHGPDPWDDEPIAHEMTHLVVHRSIRPYYPFTIAGLLELRRRHNLSQRIGENQAFTEGWADFAGLHWGSQHGSTDRLRGFAMTASSGIRLGGISNTGGAPRDHLFGGADSAGAPTFDAPGAGLVTSAYVANALYQIATALTDPGIAFADSPAYWYPFNARVSAAASRRFADTVWRALRLFPADPPLAEIDRASFLYLRQVLASCRQRQAAFAETVQSIFELNDLLMPRLAVTAAAAGGGPGAALADPAPVAAGGRQALVVRVTDASGATLRGYNLRFALTADGGPGDAAHLALPGGPGPEVRHGVRAPAAPAAGEAFRATNADGLVALAFAPPAALAGATRRLTVSYQPDFDTDASFAPPAAGDDRETTLRKLYLHALRAAAKTWSGTGNNLGARVALTVAFRVTAP